MMPGVDRAGDLVLTGGAEGSLAKQVDGIGRALESVGAQLTDLCLLRAFYRQHDVDPVDLTDALARVLPDSCRTTLTLVPVAHAGAGDGSLSIEAAAVTSRLHAVEGTDGPFAHGVRRGEFLFLGGQAADKSGTLAEESTGCMQALGRTLDGLGGRFGDIVKMNRWYRAAGTKDEWEPSARATAAFYSEPGPIATAISLPALLPGGRSIQIELMGMIGEDGDALPKTHSWPPGSWDWPIHLPYKHGLACGGLGFVGGQVSLDAEAQVIDPEDLAAQVQRSLENVDRVAQGLGEMSRRLHLGVYFEVPDGGLAGTARGAAELRALGTNKVPAILAGFDYLSYPDMRVEIEAIVSL